MLLTYLLTSKLHFETVEYLDVIAWAAYPI